MQINKYFKEFEIEPIENIDVIKRVEFVNAAALKLIKLFSEQNLDYIKILQALQSTEICISKIPSNIAPANYSYKEQIMYVSDKIDLSLNNEFIWHELIHRIQESKNTNGKLVQLGLCAIKETKVQGLAINEAAIQYVVRKILNNENNLIEIYGMKIPTKSKRYYAILTNLIDQLVLVVGDYTLIESVLNSNEEFKYNSIDILGEAKYFTIEANFDKILEAKNNIMQSNNEIEFSKNINNIKKLYIDTQDLILQSYFNSVIKRVENLEELYNVKFKLEEYSKYIGTEEGLKKYVDYYEKIIYNIEVLEAKFKNKSLIELPNGRIAKLIFKIKQAITALLSSQN